MVISAAAHHTKDEREMTQLWMIYLLFMQINAP